MYDTACGRKINRKFGPINPYQVTLSVFIIPDFKHDVWRETDTIKVSGRLYGGFVYVVNEPNTVGAAVTIAADLW